MLLAFGLTGFVEVLRAPSVAMVMNVCGEADMMVRKG